MKRYRYVASPALADARFAGGAVGFSPTTWCAFSSRPCRLRRRTISGCRKASSSITDTLLIFDHRTRRLRIVANALDRATDAIASAYARRASSTRSTRVIVAEIARAARSTSRDCFADHAAPQVPTPTGNTTREEYMKMVSDGQEFIRAGDIFQFVPSQRFETDYTGDPLTLYRALRFVNPSPYMFCMNFAGRFALVGSSPEVHVRAIEGTDRDPPHRRHAQSAADRRGGRSQRRRPARRSEGTRRAPHARRSRAQRRGPRERVWQREGDRLHDHRALQPRHAHRLQRRGPPAPATAPPTT